MQQIESIQFTYHAGPDTPVIAEITTDDGEMIRYTMSTVTLMRVIEGGTATINQNLGFALADVLCKAPARGH